MKIIITRHGETEENKAGIIQGHLPGVLSELGKEQAEKLAERLKNEKIDLIISSDLARALDTAREVARFHDVEVVLDKRLRERYLGSLQRKTWDEVGFVKGQSFKKFIEGTDAEDDNSMKIRVRELIGDLLEKDTKNILIVGHAGICTFILAKLEGKKVEDIDAFMLGNTSVTIFEKKGGNMELKLLNCVEHLE